MYASSIGTSAMAAGQRALDIIGQNVANANTPGYHRQQVSLTDLAADPRFGTGVQVSSVQRLSDAVAEASLFQANSESSRLTSRVGTQQQIESSLQPGASSIDTQIQGFFNQIESLTSQPQSTTQRQVVIANASDLAQQFNSVANSLDNLRVSLNTQIQTDVAQVNLLTPQIASLNTQIGNVNATGGQANDLQDQRDALVTKLSKLIDIRVTNQPNGLVNVMGGGGPLVTGDLAGKLALSTNTNGSVSLTETTAGVNVTPTSGELAGLFQDTNVLIPGYRSQLDTLAQTLISQVDTVQATGIGISGPSTFLQGSRGVGDPTATLASQNLAIPVQAGTLAFSVTNTATGQRTLNSIAIDPATQSLNSIAAAITAASGGQVQGSVDPATDTLKLQAQSGYSFDFAGRLPSTPNAIAIGGTSVPQVTGNYTGSGNDTYSFQVLGSGTIGTTSGLQLQVTNSASSVVAVVNVGSGYTAGRPIDIGNGISVNLSAGTTANGTFSVPVIGQPDTSGILAALGVNSFFKGTDAASIGINPSLAANPNLLNASTSGQPGDASNLTRLAAVRDKNVLGGGTQTLSGYFSDLAGNVGTEVSTLNDQNAAQKTLSNSLVAQAQSASGVDVNSEMENLLSYQRMIDAASKYLSVINTTLDSIMNVIH